MAKRKLPQQNTNPNKLGNTKTVARPRTARSRATNMVRSRGTSAQLQHNQDRMDAGYRPYTAAEGFAPASPFKPHGVAAPATAAPAASDGMQVHDRGTLVTPMVYDRGQLNIPQQLPSRPTMYGGMTQPVPPEAPINPDLPAMSPPSMESYDRGTLGGSSGLVGMDWSDPATYDNHSRVRRDTGQLSVIADQAGRFARAKEARSGRTGWNPRYRGLKLANNPQTFSGQPAAPYRMQEGQQYPEEAIRPLTGYTDAGIAGGLSMPTYGRSVADKRFDADYYGNRAIEQNLMRNYFANQGLDPANLTDNEYASLSDDQKAWADRARRMEQARTEREEYLASDDYTKRQDDLASRLANYKESEKLKGDQRRQRLAMRKAAQTPRPMTALDRLAMTNPEAVVRLRGQNLDYMTQQNRLNAQQGLNQSQQGLFDSEAEMNRRTTQQMDDELYQLQQRFNQLDPSIPGEATERKRLMDRMKEIDEQRAAMLRPDTAPGNDVSEGFTEEDFDSYDAPNAAAGLRRKMGVENDEMFSEMEYNDFAQAATNYYQGSGPRKQYSDEDLDSLVDLAWKHGDAPSRYQKFENPGNGTARSIYSAVRGTDGKPLEKSVAKRRLDETLKLIANPDKYGKDTEWSKNKRFFQAAGAGRKQIFYKAGKEVDGFVPVINTGNTQQPVKWIPKEQMDKPPKKW